MLKTILIIMGSIVSINALFLCIFANFSLGVVCTVLSGLILLILGIFYEQIAHLCQNAIFKTIKNIFLVLLCAELVLISFIAIYGQNDNVTYKEDAIIVLGAAVRGDRITLPLRLRLDKAIEYHEKNPDALIVVSGGQGHQETITEAEAMEKYLLENGVNPEKIIEEDMATSTNENMRYSKNILDERFDNEYSIAFITNNFHIYRGRAIANGEGFKNVTHMHAGIQIYNYIPNYLRESLAILKMWIIDRMY